MVRYAGEQLFEQANANNNKDVFGSIIYNVKAYGAKGDGVTDDTTSIAATITAASVNGGIVFFPPGTYKTGNQTFPKNVTAWFANGAMLNISLGTTVTINGPINAGYYQLFSGSGSVAGSPKIPFVVPHWFGARGDWGFDDTSAIQKAVNFFNKIFFPAGGYVLTDTISFENKHIFGVNFSATFIVGRLPDSTKPLFAAGRTCVIEQMSFYYDTGFITGSEFRGRRVAIRCWGGPNGYPLQRGSTIRNCQFTDVGTALYDGSNSVFSVTFQDLEIINFSYAGFDFVSLNRTGNVYINIYIAQVADKYTPTYGFNLEGEESECSIHQLNIEHMRANFQLRLVGVRGLSASSIHLEGVDTKAAYNTYIYLEQVSGVINALSFYFTRMTNNGVFLVQLGTNGFTDGNPNLVTNQPIRTIEINTLVCKGLSRPDSALYPSYPAGRVGLNNITDFQFVDRETPAGTDLNWQVEIKKYVYATYTNNDDRAIYDNFPVNPHANILFLKKGELLTTGTTANRPTKRLVAGVTQYFDTTLGKMITVKQESPPVWVDGAGTTV